MTSQYSKIGADNFERAKELGVKENITDRFAYNRACQKGLALADAVVEAGDVVPDVLTIRAVHSAIFKDIHDWAGELRSPKLELPENKIHIGGAIPGDPASKLEERLHQLCEWSKADFAWAGDDGAKQALAIASFHVALKRIQAFEDGNGRTSAVFLEHQTEQKFHVHLHKSANAELYDALAMPTYSEDLVRALDTGDVKPLAKSLVESLQSTEQAQQSKELQTKLNKAAEDLLRLETSEAQDNTHKLAHERLEELRVAETAALRGRGDVDELRSELLEPDRQRAANEAFRQAQTDWMAAFEDMKRNPLEISPALRAQEAERLAGERERREAVEERAREAREREMEELRKKQEEAQSRAKSQSQSHSQSQ